MLLCTFHNPRAYIVHLRIVSKFKRVLTLFFFMLVAQNNLIGSNGYTITVEVLVELSSKPHSPNKILFFVPKTKLLALAINLYSNECYVQTTKVTRQFHLMWRPTNSRKGDDDHCWMKVNRYHLTLSDPPVMPSIWVFSVATTSLHISCKKIA